MNWMGRGVSTADVLEGTCGEVVAAVRPRECTKPINRIGIEDGGVLDILVVWGKTYGVRGLIGNNSANIAYQGSYWGNVLSISRDTLATRYNHQFQ